MNPDDFECMMRRLNSNALSIRTSHVEELLDCFPLTLDISVLPNLVNFSWYMQESRLYEKQVRRNESGLIVLEKKEVSPKGFETVSCKLSLPELCECCNDYLEYVCRLSKEDRVVVKNFSDSNNVNLSYKGESRPLALFPRSSFDSRNLDDLETLEEQVNNLILYRIPF